MAKPWSEVAASDGFKSLPPEQQDGARRQYFDDVVAPQVPAAEREIVWGQFSTDAGVGRRELPGGVLPSAAGGGRGSVNPSMGLVNAQPTRAQRIAEMDGATDPASPNYLPVTDNAVRALQTDGRQQMDSRRTNYPGRVLDKNIPGLTPLSAAQDVAAGALQIIPTAAKGVGDIARMVTGDRVGKGLSDYAERSMDAARQVVGSERAAAQKLRFEQDMTDPALNAADVVVGNPGALADQVLPTVGSMALPVGVAAVAGKLATSGRAAQLASVIDEATVLARANKVREAAAIGATVVQNAADTYSTIRDQGGEQDAAYMGAAITAPATYVAGRLTGGGAEGQAAKLLAGQRGALSAIPGAMLKEGAQEVGEEVGQYTGETVGTGSEFDASVAGKRLAVAGTLGAAMGGGVSAAGAASTLRQDQIKRLRDAGETQTADLLQQKHDRTTAAESVDGELQRMPGNPAFQDSYRQMRTAGVKPAEAAARSAVTVSYQGLAATAGIPERAAAAALEKAATLPLDQVPGFFAKFTAGLAKRGLVQPFDGMDDMTAGLEAARDDAIEAAMGAAYQPAPEVRQAMDDVMALENAQSAPADAPIEGLDTETPALDAKFSGIDAPAPEPVRPEIDMAAHDAATSPLNSLPEPTQAQKEAGNYKVGRINLHGLNISIENPEGSTRSGTSPDGTKWENTLAAHYGYIRGTEGNDGDHVDTFIGPNPQSDKVFVVDQVNKDGSFDEHKVLLGADNLEQADALYHANYHDGWTGRGAITEMPLAQFKSWVKDGAKTQPMGKLAPVTAEAEVAPTAPIATPNPDGTLNIKGDPAAIKAQLAGAGLTGIPMKGGMQVGRKQAAQAQSVFEPKELIAQANTAPLATNSIAPDGPIYLGRNNQPLTEGGKPYKTRLAAADAKKLQPMMRVIAIKGGFALAEKTEKQLAAEQKAARRLRNPQTSTPGEPIPAHAFIAAEGGLHADTRADMNVGNNPRIGNRNLFAGKGKGLSMERATARLIEEGYLSEGASHNAAAALIQRSLTQPQYNADGIERIAEAEAQTDFDAYALDQENAVAEIESLDDNEFDFLDDSDIPFGDAPSNTSTEAAMRSMGFTEEEIQDAIAQESGITPADSESRRSPGQVASSQAPGIDEGRTPAQDQEQGLTAPSQQGILDKQDRAEQADQLDAKAQIDRESSKQTLTRQTAPEQRRDNSGDMFAMEKAQAEIDQRNTGRAAKADPNQGGMFDEPAPAADQVNTPAFKQWFAGSKVVDDAGKPLAMYHGTSASEKGEAFTSFDTYASSYGLMGMGGYFTADPAVASSYTTKGKGPTPTVYKTFLSIKNPLDMDAKADPAAWKKQFDGAEAYQEGGTTNESWYRAAEASLSDEGLPMYEGAEIMQDGLRAMGYDGITHIGGGRVKDDGVKHRVYITFEPEQAKSATGNNGNFDKADPRMAFARSEQTETLAFKAWFGDSKVADKKGHPMVVYHGGNQGITIFENAQKRVAKFLVPEARAKIIDATFFTKDKRVAESYKKRINDRAYSDSDPTGVMYETYLSIQNPMVIDMAGGKYHPGKVEGQMQAAKAAGHDGMIVTNIVDDFSQKGKPTDIYVTFNPEQIKSATANNGDFDGNNPDITMARAMDAEAFRRMFSPPSATPVAEVQKMVDELSAKWQNGPAVKVVRTPADLPVRAPWDARGLIHKGTAYIVVSNNPTRDLVARTLAHEAIGHHGLWAILGDEGAKRFSRNVQLAVKSGNVPLNKIAAKVRRLYVDEKGNFNLSAKQESDEIAAFAVEDAVDPATGEFKPGYGFVKEVYAKLAAWLRDTMGIKIPFTMVELHGMLVSAMHGLEAGKRFEGGGESVAASRSAMKSIDANVRRGLESLAKALDEKTTVHRAMFRNGLGWVDFVWGDAKKGILHIIERRQASDGMTNAQAIRFIQDELIPVIAEGVEIRRNAVNGNIRVVIASKSTQAVLVRTGSGSNAWMLTGFELKPGAEVRGATQSTDTQSLPILSRQAMVAGKEIVAQNDPDGNPGSRFARGIPMPGPGLFQPTIWSTPDATRTDRIIYELQDGKVDLKRVQQAITKSGQQIEEKWDARLAETLYPGRVAHRSQTFLEIEAKPLLEAMTRNNVPMNELADYLHARGAEERNKQIAKVNPAMPDGGAGTNSEGTLLTTQAARDYLANVRPARKVVLDAMAKRVDTITAGTRRLLVAEGLEKQETIDAWEGAYKNYVPMFRDEAESAMPPHPQGSGFAVKGSASKRATGSTKEVTNILAHVLMQREAAITRAEKNRVALALYGQALSHPNPAFWTTIKPSMSNAQIGAELVAMGVDPLTAQVGMEGVPTIRTVDPITGKVVNRANPMYQKMPGAIPLKVNGEDRVLMLNVTGERGLRLAESLKNLDGLTQLDLAGSIIGKSTRWLAAVNTQYNPAFGLVNLTRDTLGGAINLGSTELRGNALKVLAKTPAAILGIARELASGGQSGKWQALYRQFQADGGQTGFKENFRDPNDRAKAIEKELASLGRGILSPGRAAHFMLDLLDGFNTSLENAVRLSAYSEALGKGMSRANAARLGRELTVDFNRKGRAGREVGPLYAFFNASVQGSARTIEALKGPTGWKIIAGGLSMGMLQAMMLAAAGYDDDEIPEFVKTRALIIPMFGKEKTYISIPYPLGVHVIPNTGRVLAELVLNGGKDIGTRMQDAVGEIAGAFNPMGGGNILTTDGALKTMAPTLIDPVIELGFNRNFAGGRIEKEGYGGESDNRPGVARTKEATQRSTTGQVYMGISKAINTMTGGTDYEKGVASPTPERVRYLAQTVGGGVLREIEKTVNASTAASRGEKVKMSQIPVAGRFYGEVDADQVQMSRYYDAAGKLHKLDSTLKVLDKADQFDAADAYEKAHPEIDAIEDWKRAKQAISKLNKQAVETIGNAKEMAEIDEDRLYEMRELNDSIKKLELKSGKSTLAAKLREAVKPEAREAVAAQ